MILYINKNDNYIEYYEEENLNIANKVPVNSIDLRISMLLFYNVNRISSREELTKTGWPNKEIGNNSLNVCIMKLRKKLKKLNSGIEIKSYPSQGYKLILPYGVKAVSKLDINNRVNNYSQRRWLDINVRKYNKRPKLLSLTWCDIIVSIIIIIYSISLYFSLYY